MPNITTNHAITYTNTLHLSYFLFFFYFLRYGFYLALKKANETRSKTFGEDGNDSELLPKLAKVPRQTFNKRHEKILRENHVTEKKRK